MWSGCIIHEFSKMMTYGWQKFIDLILCHAWLMIVVPINIYIFFLTKVSEQQHYWRHAHDMIEYMRQNRMKKEILEQLSWTFLLKHGWNLYTIVIKVILKAIWGFLQSPKWQPELETSPKYNLLLHFSTLITLLQSF